MLDERDRIAADLHDHVIQRLFAAGLSLQSVATSLGGGPVADRVLATVQDLDATIGQIRTTIFQLHELPVTAPGGLRAKLLDVVAEATPALGFEPAARFPGAGAALPAEIAEDLVAVARPPTWTVGSDGPSVRASGAPGRTVHVVAVPL